MVSKKLHSVIAAAASLALSCSLCFPATLAFADEDQGEEETAASTSTSSAAALTYQDIENGYIHVESADDALSTQTTTDLPSSYSNRSVGPVVRDQGYYGCCWAFASVGAVEYSLITKGVATSSIDQAERQLVYFFYNKQGIADPLGNIENDYNTSLADDNDYMNVGNSLYFTSWALTSWMGTTDESVARYSAINSDAMFHYYRNNYATFAELSTLSSNKAFSMDSYHVQNVDYIPFSNQAAVKQAIMDNGSVAFSYYDVDWLFNSNSNAYYNNTYNDQTNHAVLIVGWDDDFDSSNFYNDPGVDGAWLVRNSWGSDTDSHSGYFWLSYVDCAVKDADDVCFCIDAESADNYDNNYQYDGSCGQAEFTVESGRSVANVYTANGCAEGNETLEAIGLGTISDNAQVSVQIYKNLTNASNPTSGTACLSTPVSASFSYAGYHTIDLGQEITLEEGDTFSIVISNASTSTLHIAAEQSYTNSNWISFTAETASGQSFANRNGSWYDLNSSYSTFGETSPLCIRIKGYTVDHTMKSIADATIEAVPDQTYAGSAVTPSLSVSYNGTALAENTDYTVSYANNDATGTATATITGIGEYRGTQTVQFLIVSPEAPRPQIDGMSLTTGGRIGINWYVNMGCITPDNASDYVISFTYKGETTTVDPVFAESGDSKYTFDVAAKEMTQNVTLTIATTDGFTLATSTKCAADYLRQVMAMSAKQRTALAGSAEAGVALNELCRSSLEYGGCTQLLFDYSVDNLASSGVTSALSGVVIDSSYKAQVSKGQNVGVQSYSTSLVLDSDVAVRLYLVLSSTTNASDISVTVNGQAATMQPEYDESGQVTRYYVERANIAAADLGSPIVFAVSNSAAGTTYVYYSPLSYAYSMQSCGNANTENLARALYNYNQAAIAYFG